MQIVRPNEPEFNYHELFPGNLRPPPQNSVVTAEVVRTALNLYRDNFQQQQKFSRDLRTDMIAVEKRIETLQNWLVVTVLFFALAFGYLLAR